MALAPGAGLPQPPQMQQAVQALQMQLQQHPANPFPQGANNNALQQRFAAANAQAQFQAAQPPPGFNAGGPEQPIHRALPALQGREPSLLHFLAAAAAAHPQRERAGGLRGIHRRLPRFGEGNPVHLPEQPMLPAQAGGYPQFSPELRRAAGAY